MICKMMNKIALMNRQVRAAERYNWAATRGVNEEMLFENLPENLQRDIRRHLFKFVKNVNIVSSLSLSILLLLLSYLSLIIRC